MLSLSLKHRRHGSLVFMSAVPMVYGSALTLVTFALLSQPKVVMLLMQPKVAMLSIGITPMFYIM